LLSAYLLVSHGSRDPRPQVAVDRLAQQLSLYLQQDSPALVATAQLELADRSLHLQIIDFTDKCIENGIERVTILPLFLNPGVHVMDDIPAEVALAKREIGERLKLTVAPFLSTYPDFINLFAESRSQLPSSTIILAHGSRREGGNTIVEQLAAGLNAEIAYWSIEPSLTDRVAALVATGVTEIGILPYFLFTGGITDAIAELVTKLRQQFPQVRLRLGEPIGNSPEFVQTIGEILRSIAACTPSPDNGNI
jgi:sirohydrochlorin cobaltochelatase